MRSCPAADGVHLVLASGSPRRAELLGELGIDFDIAVPDVDERPLPHEDPTSLVRRLAANKRDAVLAARPDATVIAADTIVVVDGSILGKPASPDDASAMLRSIGGRSHEVLTGVAVGQADTRVEEVCQTTVTFRPLTDDEVSAYVATGDPLDKAGAYGIQQGAARFVERVEGNYQSVIGLPLTVVERLLATVTTAAEGTTRPPS